MLSPDVDYPGGLKQGRVNQTDVNRVTLPEMTDWHVCSECQTIFEPNHFDATRWLLTRCASFSKCTVWMGFKLSRSAIKHVLLHHCGQDSWLKRHPSLHFLFCTICTVQMVGGYYYEIMVVVGLIKTVKMTMMIIQQAIVRRGGGYRSPIARHPILTLDRVPPGRYIITSIIASSPFDVHPISGYIFFNIRQAQQIFQC